MSNSYLKIPVNLAEFCLREGKVSQVQTYVAAQIIYSGKVRIEDKPHKTIAGLLNCSPRTVQRHFKWLLERDWMGKDTTHGWLFFRGLDFISEQEGWRQQAVAMQHKDIRNFKSFLTTAVIAAIITFQRQNGTDPLRRGSKQTGFPVSLKVIANWLKVCEKTAFNIRKQAAGTDLLGMGCNLWQLSDIEPADVHRIRQNDIASVTSRLFGTASQKAKVSVNRLRTRYGKVFVQMPNLCNPQRVMRSR